MANPSGTLAGLSSLKLALMAKQARAQLGPIARAEPIAVIGMGCRFPGGADSPEAYWALLRDGVDAVGEIPRDRWDVDALYDPDPAAPAKMSARYGGFLGQVDRFDAPFFGILRREAERMDPQHRLFLEVAIEALDHAGLSRERLAGSATGAFIASYYNDYTLMQFADREWIDGRTLTGTQHSVLANRLSYLLDLRGPSISIDTACSSSLVAIHLACQSLRTGESDTAISGGVSLMLAPEMMITLSKVGFMSPSGRCRTFDAGADGFIRGEGCGVVVLKRLSDAISDNDRVLAVIRGSAVNQDGHSTVLAAPNGLAQQALVRQALSNAQLSPSRVGFVEAHGTATPLGDPIEVEALAATVGAPRADGSTCYLGSAKANLGHLEAASGVAGLIKATLVLQHAEIPGQVHFERLNTHLSLNGTCLKVADRHRAWPAGAEPRVAGVSGFGVGGTNAHVLLEEAPSLPEPAPLASDALQLLALSANSASALRALASAWLEFLPKTAASLTSLTATAADRRSHYDHRLALLARSKDQVEAELRAFLAGQPSPALAVGHRPASGSRQIAFVFSGQGPQWPQMASELSASEPVFRDALADLDGRFQALAGWSLSAALAEPAESSRLQQTELAQPAIFALQVALAALWQSYGIEPTAVVGHSIGELAALYVAGVLSLDDAVRIVWHRGRIMQRATGLGGMLAVGMTEAEAQALLKTVGPELSLAAINGPRSIVLAGTPRALEATLAELAARGVSHRALPVSYAFHSAQMEPFQAELVAAIGSVRSLSGRIAVYSSVTGAAIDHTTIDAGYFGRNLRQTVRFAGAIDALVDSGVHTFLELSPHPVLASSIGECLAARDQQTTILASMRRERPARETLLRACAGAYAVGHTPRWSALLHTDSPPVDLPAYPWQRERYWLRTRPLLDSQTPALAPALLGARRAESDGSISFDVRWPSDDLKWINDHQVGGHTVMPAVALLEALRRAAEEVYGRNAATVLEFLVHQPFLLDAASGWTLFVSPEGSGARLELWAASDAERALPGRDRLIASARLRESSSRHSRAPEAPGAGEWQTETHSLYARFAELGVDFGPAFRTIERWRAADVTAEAWLTRKGTEDLGLASGENGAGVTLLDGALQLCLIVANDARPDTLLLPVAVESYALPRPLPERVRAQVRITERGAGGTLTAAVRLFAEDERLVAALDGVHLAPADAAALADVGPYEIRWRELPATPASAPLSARGSWLVLSDGSQQGRALVAALKAHGGQCYELCSSADPDQLTRALSEFEKTRADAPLRGIVHAWSFDAAAPDLDERADWLTTGSALILVQALGQGLMPGVPLWLLTQAAQPVAGPVLNPRQAGLWGLASVVAPEYPDRPCHVIDLDPSCAGDTLTALVSQLVQLHPTGSRQALRGAIRYAPLLERRAEMAGAAPLDGAAIPSQLVAARPGTLDGLEWQASQPALPRAGELRLRVLAAGLNFRDVLLALGIYPGEGAVLGAECAGIVTALGADVSQFQLGDIVFGFAPGSISTEVVVPAHFLVALPASLRAEEAAGLPAAFLTAMYGLERIAKLERGARVLIHAGAGGVGLAAIQVALRAGCRVFATAGSPAKRELLSTLGVEQVFDSRSLAFADGLLRATDGAGVQVLLNSLSGDFIPAGLRTLAPGGWFLELGKRDAWTAEQMAATRADVRYRRYDLGEELKADPSLAPSLLSELCHGLSDGTLRPLPVRVFAFGDAREAFRLMAQAGHVGKLVLRAPARSARELIQAGGTYWITGGGGALGAQTARWLVNSGARQLLLSGRQPPPPEAQAIIDECVAQGARVEFRLADASDSRAMSAIRDEISSAWPPLRGVVHAAGVVDDGMLVHQTWTRWRDALRGKAGGARVLDALTRDTPLDFFVLYSSAGWLLGPLGQGAYAAANAELDALAWARRASGRAALSVAWGQWREGGMAARMRARGHDGWSARGLGWLASREAFRQLERLLGDGSTHAVVLPIDWGRFLSTLSPGVDSDFFQAVRSSKRSAARPAFSASSPEASLVEQWSAAPSGARRELLLAHLDQCARHVLGLADDVVLDVAAPLKSAGLDSLMAVELRNVLTRSLGSSLPATLLFDYPSLDALVAYLLIALKLTPVATAMPASTLVGEQFRAVASLTDAEAEALLLAELDAGSVGSR